MVRKSPSRKFKARSAIVPSSKFNKRYVKLIASTNNKPISKRLIESAPIPVLKLISNAAIHAQRGNIELNKHNKEIFRKNRALFTILTNRKYNFNRKRRALSQKGGSALLPILLSTVLSAIGPLLFKNS